ncbi:hypothetical protein [Paenibacillus sp. OSY-SE]|uniref:hypothetical protein n=1 Tax=Paenibacillus sp. OSY-SE TaxID=1196323 RepID=UPI0003713EEC|nr:hypothetical protein [Paenibacillus sp. OSY-SE]
MRRLRIRLLLPFIILSGCYHNQAPTETSIHQQPNNYMESNESAHNIPEKALPIKDAVKQVPFTVMQPEVPFEVTDKSARVFHTQMNFDAIEISYLNTKQGLNLLLTITNSQHDTGPKGKKYRKLDNQAQTWDQANEFFSALYWRHDGLTYVLFSGKETNGTTSPLYSNEQLLEIANTIE